MGGNDNPVKHGVDAASTVPPQRASRGAWIGLWVLVLVYVLNFIDRNIIAILAEDIKADLKLSDAEIGFLYGTAFGVFYALFGVPLGKLADNWHRVRLMALGLSLWSAMTIFSGFSRNLTTLGVARMGVGVGEATASPAAYSLISDWFPKRQRATALAIYSSGLYLGAGVSLLIGGLLVGWWQQWFPVDPPLGLKGWQAAFIMVGLPGLLLTLFVLMLREPVRGESDGLIAPPHPAPFAAFFAELVTIIPPLTLIGAARRGGRALMLNIGFAAALALAAGGMTQAFGNAPQWVALGVGYYAVFSWASSLRASDAPAFRLIWGNRAFVCTALGYACISFLSYASSSWAPAYAMRTIGVPQAEVGFWIGGPGALAGFLGVILGGALSDRLRARHVSGRLWVVLAGLVVPSVPMALAFTATDATFFYSMIFTSSLLSSTALGAAAATTQDLVLTRMRGVATATFFLATTLGGLALGPFTAGQISTMTGSLSTGMLSLLAIVPVGAALLLLAIRSLPEAEATMIDRARAAGEAI